MCKSCRSRKMLKNDYLLAKIGADTAENEPRKERCVVARAWPPATWRWIRARPSRACAMCDRDTSAQKHPEDRPQCHSADLSMFIATTQHSFRGSFSAVSRPILATKYSFCSIFQDLQDLHNSAPLGTQIFGEICPKFSENCQNFRIFLTSF